MFKEKLTERGSPPENLWMKPSTYGFLSYYWPL
jgi:hypothetical protein